MTTESGSSAVRCLYFPLNILFTFPTFVTATFRSFRNLFTSIFYTRGEEVGTVSSLRVHPGRAMRETYQDSWFVGKDGFLLDKRLCLWEDTGKNGDRVNHKKSGSESLFDVRITLESIEKVVFSYKELEDLEITYSEIKGDLIFDEKNNEYLGVGEDADTWFSKVLSRKVKMVFVPYKNKSNKANIPPSLDPVLIFAESSMDNVSDKAGWQVEVERFRPNIMVKDCPEFADELWQEVKIGSDLVLEFSHRCTRCLIVNACDGEIKPDTFKTLLECRPREKGKPVLGSYFTVKKTGVVDVGDKIVVLKKRTTEV